MSDKHCCVTWQELNEELAEARRLALEETMEKNSLPKSMFASVFRVLDSMGTYCPVCGEGLTEDAQKKRPKLKESDILPDDSEELDDKPKERVYHPKRDPKPRKCPACKGRRVIGKSTLNGEGIAIKCMKCHGNGVIDQRHLVRDSSGQDGLPEAGVVRGNT